MKRKSIPLSVKVAVLERQLCALLCCDKIEYDHRPPLYLRERIYDGYVPFENDPAYIEAVPKLEHRKRTHGTKATSYGSDAHERAKTKRLVAQYHNVPIYETDKLKQQFEALITQYGDNPAVRKLINSRPLPGGRNSPYSKTLSGKVIKRSKPK